MKESDDCEHEEKKGEAEHELDETRHDPVRRAAEGGGAVGVLGVEVGDRQEQRPPAGVWGGLLSLPELPDAADVRSHCERQLGVRLGAVRPAPTFTHGFTHFRLKIRPLICTVAGMTRAAEPGLRWFDAAAAAQAALPAPIRRIVSAIP